MASVLPFAVGGIILPFTTLASTRYPRKRHWCHFASDYFLIGKFAHQQANSRLLVCARVVWVVH